MSAVVPDGSEARVGPQVSTVAPDEGDLRSALQERAARVFPVPGESASSFAARLIARLAPVAPPDFGSLLAAKAAMAAEAGRPLRMLSLGSGAAVAESALLQHCPHPVELALTGNDEALLSAALAAFQPRHRVSYRVVDLEGGLSRWKERFDVVFSHATFSRIVRLEPLLLDVRRLLAADSELWLSREYVGHPAGRMDERDAARAEALFLSFPARLRRSGIDGAELGELPAIDSADVRLNGRHGERLIPWLHKCFAPLAECTGNALLWRVLPSSIVVNFNLARADDLEVLRSAAVEDALHVRSGGRPVMLDGVYRCLERLAFAAS